MTPAQIEALGPALGDYLQQFLFCCGYTQTFDLLGLYCRGLLSDLDRKSAEPIALAAGLPARTLQEFLKDHQWSFAQVRDQLQQHVAGQLADRPADEVGNLGLVDETGQVKKGTKTPGVQRQWCGEVGKLENCIVTVHVGVARGRYSTLLDSDLFLPQAWDQDRPRCRAAGIPDDVRYRPKWQIALGQIDRVRAQGLTFDWWTFDEGYGSKPGFLYGLDQRRQRYVAEVPKSFRCLGRRRRGRTPSSRADDLVRHSPLFTRQRGQRCGLTRQTLAEQEWQVKTARVWLPWEQRRKFWLIWACNVRTGEEKYFVSNAPKRTPVRLLLRVAFGRWHIEHDFRVSKGEMGFRHFEGRSYTGLMRHQVLCCVMLTFGADQAERLRGEKPTGDAGAGVSGPARGVPALAGRAAGDEPVAVCVGGHRVSPAA
jgi:SRSO17 transposase